MRTISCLLACSFLIASTLPTGARADDASPAPSPSVPSIVAGTISPIQIDNCRLDYVYGGLFGALGKPLAR